MEIKERTQEDIDKLNNEFAERLLNLMIEKSNLDNDIKDLKKEYRLEGADVKNIVKGINSIKKQLKSNPIEESEAQRIEDLLIENDSVKVAINDLCVNS